MSIVSKSQIIEEKFKVYLNNLYRDFKLGEIKSPIELQYKLFQALTNMYSTINKPVFVPRLANKYPISEDFNNMIYELSQDLTILFNETNNINDSMEQEFNYIDIQRQRIIGNIKNLNSRADKIISKIQL